MNWRRVCFLLYYAAAVSLIAMMLGRGNWLTYFRLANAGVATSATVTEGGCANGTFPYRFTVDGKDVVGRGGDGYGNPPCSALKPGARVQVWYLPAAPQTNAPGDPKEWLERQTPSIALSALFLPLVLLVILFLLVRRVKKT